MKFEHQLQINCVPEWQEHYINYGALKRLVYGKSLDRRGMTLSSVEGSYTPDREGESLSVGQSPLRSLSAWASVAQRTLSEPLLDSSGRMEGSPAALAIIFLEACSKDLTRVDAFYSSKLQDLEEQLKELDSKVVVVEKSLEVAGVHHQQHAFDTSSAGAAVGTASPLSPSERRSFWALPHSGGAPELKGLETERKKLDGEMRALYLALSDLLTFASLNTEGFRKICKKFDKETGEKTQERFMEDKVADCHMRRGKAHLQELIDKLVALYALVKWDGDDEAALAALKKKQREYFVYERRTVFQEMMERERTRQAAHLKEEMDPKQLYTKWAVKAAKCVTFSGIFLALLLGPRIFSSVEQQNCFALLVFASLMWAFEAVPLYVTAMSIPFFVVVLRVLRDPHSKKRLHPDAAADAIFHAMYSQVIFLLLGGFVIAAALTKHFIARRMATAVLTRVGNRPASVLLAIMLIATAASTFISNVTAPALCFAILQPILRASSNSDPLSKALIMGVALASNLGGMMSPISSPQNIFAIERMSLDGEEPSWLQWFAVSIPVALCCNLVCWVVLLMVYRPGRGGRTVKKLPQINDKLSYKQVFVVAVTVFTVFLWCANSLLSKYTGDMGVLACIPLVAFCGFGIMRKDAFDTMAWNIIMLAQGGLALGEAVKSSGLLETIATELSGVVKGCTVWQVLVIFCALVLLFTTFISHTVGAMIILPILQSIGEHMEDGHPRLLVMGAALMCSGAMGLPISGFPNIFASGQVDASGVAYISGRDFHMVGLPCSVATYAFIITVGYKIMQWVGF